MRHDREPTNVSRKANEDTEGREAAGPSARPAYVEAEGIRYPPTNPKPKGLVFSFSMQGMNIHREYSMFPKD